MARSSRSSIAIASQATWTLITYMFYHWDFMHILFNMLWLFWMEKFFQEYLENKSCFTTYLLGGISGGSCIYWHTIYFHCSHLPSKYLPLLGASQECIGNNYCNCYPCSRITYPSLCFSDRLNWNTLLLLLFFRFNKCQRANAWRTYRAYRGHCLALYIKQLKKGNDIAAWLSKLIDFITPGKNQD